MDNGIRIVGYGIGLVAIVALLFLGLRSPSSSSSSSSSSPPSENGGGGGGFWGSVDWGKVWEGVWGLLGGIGGGSSAGADDLNRGLAAGE